MRRIPILSGAFLCAALALFGSAETASAIAPVPPSVLNSNADSDSGDDNVPSVATDGVGNWVAVWSSAEDLGATLGTDLDILVSRSSDNGATWTAPVALHSHFAADTGDDQLYGPLATDGAGNWLVVWASNDDLDDLGWDLGADADILASRSTDNGATWSAPAPVNSDAETDLTSSLGNDGHVLKMAMDGSGTAIVTWYAYKMGGADTDMFFARSTDSGATWSDLAPLNTNAASDTGDDYGSAPLATDGAGNWVVVWGSREDLESTGYTDWDALVARSSDDGVTWSDPEYLHAYFESDPMDEEFRGWVATDGAGDWLTVWMSGDSLGLTIGTDLDLLMSRSTDNGASWTYPAPLNANAATDGNKHEWGPRVVYGGDGNWVAVWRNHDYTGGPLGADGDVLASRSTDDGASWSWPTHLHTNADSDSGGEANQFPATDGKGNWVAIWQSEENLGGTIGTDLDILSAAFALRTVDSTGDAGDFSTADGVCDTDDSAGDGPCTLRAAIQQANANSNLDNIYFDIDASTDPGCNAGTGVCTIQPASALPTITQPVAIDGYTQDGASANTNPLSSGSNAVLKIELDGTNAGASDGLNITAGGSTIKGLVIDRFGSNGIEMVTNGGNTIEGNFIGTDVTGLLDRGNGDLGVVISGFVDENTIGGSTAAARNLISGNGLGGVYIEFGDGNTVAGNFIGTDVTGAADLSNTGTWGGVTVYQGAGNTIGGSSAGEGNVISADGVVGVQIIGVGADGNFVKGNSIGVGATGLALPIYIGIYVYSGAQNNTIGGTTTPGACDTDCNLISGATLHGVRIVGAGTSGNTVSGNYIGVDATGSALGNTRSGVAFENGPSGNTVGGTAAGEGNLIAFNGAAGVCVRESGATGNAIRGNSIHSNAYLGIDLVPTGGNCLSGLVTPNDAGDGDTGPNQLMNFPVITSASYDAVDTTISGTLDTGDPTNSTVDVYASDAADASGYGEGRVHLGSTTAPGGSWTLVVSGASPYIYLSATATDSSGNTSEFSLVPGTDGDSDGLADLYETNTGVYVSPTNTGSDPADPDSDDDGLDDGEEVNTHSSDPNDTDSDDDGLDDGDEVNVYGTDPILADTDEDGLEDGEEVALGTDPTDPDHDDDTICDGGGTGGGACTAGPDNCPFIANPGQTNSDGLAAGDDCQCGDVNGDLAVDSLDMQIAREKLVGATLSGAFDVARCDFTGAGGTVCEVDDLFVLERLVLGASTPLANACPAYFGP